MSANLPDPIEPDRVRPLDYARADHRTPGQRFARGCLIALGITVVVIALLLGTCAILVHR
jgi:hypothetical protein